VPQLDSAPGSREQQQNQQADDVDVAPQVLMRQNRLSLDRAALFKHPAGHEKQH
jgi:hypothetical protein